MSYTVIHDQRYEKLQIENSVNRAVRRCKIGAVRYKADYPKSFRPYMPPIGPLHHSILPVGNWRDYEEMKRDIGYGVYDHKFYPVSTC